MTNMNNSTTLKDQFIELLAGKILNGDLKPGERLPSERELAKQTGISRSIVHLALVDLERARFVETNARHGTYVCDFIKKGNIDTLNFLIQFNGADFNSDRILDLLEMRMAIEGEALELLMDKLKDDDLKILENDIAEARKISCDQEINDAKLATSFFTFHHDICVLSGNFILPLLFNTFEYVTLAYWEKAISNLGRTKCIDLLEGFFGVIKKGDADQCKLYLQKEFEIYMSMADQA